MSLLLKRVENAQRVWALLIPHVPPPSPDWFGRWCGYPTSIVEHAIIRTSKKFCPAKTLLDTDPEQVWRYAGSVMNNEEKQRLADSTRYGRSV